MEEVKNIMVEASDNKKLVKVLHEFDDFVAPFSYSYSSFESGNSSGSLSSLKFSNSFEEVTSSAPPSSSSNDPLSDMSILLQQLPIKRGLSKYYQGKAQSFTSLAKVKSLEDLAKPENPYNKKLKSWKSYGEEISEDQNAKKCTNNTPSATSSTLASRGSCSSLIAKKGSDNNFMGNRPPIPPHRSTSSINIPNNQTILLV